MAKKRKAAKRKSTKSNPVKSATKDTGAVMHVMLAAPVSMRKYVLTTAIEATQLLKQYEQFAEIKEKKVRTLKSLQRTMTSVRNFSKQLEKALPKLPLEEKKKLLQSSSAIEAVPLAPTKSAPPKPMPPKEISEIDRLKAELAEVEGKLGKL